MEDEYDEIFRIVIVGDTTSGKTNILMKYIKNSFNCDSKHTVGVDLFSKLLKLKGI